MANPRIILWDIETVMNKVATFRLLNQDMLPHRNILQERYVVSAAWMELGDTKVESVSVLDYPDLFKKNPNDDSGVLKKLHEVLMGADVLVAHNGDGYDLPFTKTRMLIQGLPTLPPIQTIDTLKVAKKHFYFNSNRLDYLGQVLGVGKKKENEEDLWLKVLAGDKQAIKNMVAYNKQDIILLRDVFLKLQPYIPNYLNRQLFGQKDGKACPRCGSTHTQSRGLHMTQTNQYQRFQCMDCGGWYRLKTADKVPTTIRVL